MRRRTRGPERQSNIWKREGVAADAAAEMAKEALAILAHPDFAPLFAEGSRAEVPIVADLAGSWAPASG